MYGCGSRERVGNEEMTVLCSLVSHTIQLLLLDLL